MKATIYIIWDYEQGYVSTVYRQEDAETLVHAKASTRYYDTQMLTLDEEVL